jgi:hypothetical protein
VKRGEMRLRFFRRYGDEIVHLRAADDGITLCGVSMTAEFGGYMTGPTDVPGAPEPTCAVCIERLASLDLAAELLDVARRTRTRHRLRLRR